MIYVFRFFTAWVMLMHIIFLIPNKPFNFPNTFLLALVVYCGYGYIRIMIERIPNRTWHYYLLDIVGHIVPLLVIRPKIEVRSVILLVVLLWLYMEYHEYRYKRVMGWYSDWLKYSFQK